jgi:tripartite-type tricarboxylate transporter receptor subunit TctC
MVCLVIDIALQSWAADCIRASARAMRFPWQGEFGRSNDMRLTRHPKHAAAVAASTIVLVAASMAQPALCAGVEEFYRGKSISLIIGYSVGGGYDLYGRLLARHLGKYLPGRPNIVPQNLTGAGSLRAANFLYAAAVKDGTVIGTFGRTIVTTPLLMPANAQFDATRFTWLGSITNEVSTCVTWHTSPVKSWTDSLQTAITMGGEGTGADPDVYALLYKHVFGTKWRLVTGYQGTNDTTLAMERGEVDGLCGLSWNTLKTRHLQWLQEKKINIIIQAALQKQPELAGVPLALDLTEDADRIRILKLFLTTQEMARPFAAPPDIPVDRKAALISAFDQTMQDPDFLADAGKLNMDVSPLDSRHMDRLLAELYATPRDLVDRAAQAVAR